MKILVIALLVSGLLSFAAATYLTVMIGFDFMPYSKARGAYVGLLFFLGSGFMYATAMTLKSQIVTAIQPQSSTTRPAATST